ncbi:MAG TPA: GrpB family protein [Chloroflexota bacterium]|nr:GrpB family protein [Chloroflexota bacterium]
MEPREKPGAGPLGPEDGVELHRVVGHHDNWWHDFNGLAVVLARDIPDVVAVEHIGSTAIPGMPARDILDVEVIVTKIEDETAFSAPLQRLGFRRFNPPDLAAAGLRLFVPEDGSGRIHIHVCELGSAQHRRHVAVRDYLRAHPDEARRYADLKREAARLAEGNRVAYSRAKDRYLQALEQTALRWNESLHDQ